MNRRTVVIGTVALAAAGFAAAAAYYPGGRAPAAPEGENTLVRPHSPVIGPADAPVTIVEFLDPSCEACRAFYPIVKQILAAYPEKTRLVIRYAPLHEGSDEAVRILEAARVQDKFVAVLEKLFFEQPNWAVHGAPDVEAAWRFAGEAGLDVAKARGDAKAPSVVAVLNKDIEDMKAVGLQGTPTFFVNGKPLSSFGPQQLHDLVAAEVKAADGAQTQ
ncbi:thioredoxin domain-containing protein [Pseudaminobacter sp. 19-2017]|uniref:Thioredoxin domain-containing protein n=1 Tax=Pseudaminobacter soli (ex Zhang et al. 2022) TaxID=2831468 RepID=A0A942I4I8_9HYPH|nr:thioredoxin domain-containing protein [Pseudaminobacter soli]MBS3651963.1 thioredoxin domain-containing protein [Pseudaminobacter soli]